MKVALVLVLVAGLGAGSGYGAWWSEQASDPGPRAEVSATTALLSVRRVPEALLQPRRDASVAAGVSTLPDRLPGDSCLVVTEQGRTLFEHEPSTPLIPASTQKLLVGATVLQFVEPDAVFETTVVSTEPVVDGTVSGDVWLVGGGDPLLATDDFVARNGDQDRRFTRFESLADAIVEAGIVRIAGSVVGDGTRYDEQRDVSSWLQRYRDQVSAGPLSGLVVNQGLVSFTPERVSVNPGTPASDPPAHAASLLVELLEERGVEVTGGADSGEAPDGATVVARLESLPVVDVIAHMMQWSDNTVAELLLKEVGVRGGAEGSTVAGGSVVHSTLASLGVRGEGLVVADGSGLDLGNRAHCRALADLLDIAGPESHLASTLAVSAESGTLRDRLVDTPGAGQVSAKTGSLRHVVAMSGFVSSANGHTYTFAVISNLDESEFMPPSGGDLIDELMLSLATLAPVDVPAELEPLPPRGR